MSDALLEVRDTIHRLLLRDLRAMQREIDAYVDDETLWRVVPGISNPGGTHALHIAGNLRYFLGTVLNDGSYVRDREHEFSARGQTRAEVSTEIVRAMQQVTQTLSTIDTAQLEAPYPIKVLDVQLRTDAFLMHLAVHLAYHLGQLDYHRRIVSGDSTTVNTMGTMALIAQLPNMSTLSVTP